MKKKWIMLAVCAALFTGIEAMACTGLLVGKKASVDGSVMISYSADSHTLYGELYRWPAAVWPKGSMLDVVEWDTGKPLGKIPQVEQTYSVIGNMNEYQVAITESTWGGRPELEDSTGIMDYGSLIYIALQRSKSAREAIKVMTDLVKEHGYYSSGETFSIADKNEAWVMELIGKGVGNKGAVWVAIRIPDDCISAHANQARIQQIPFKDKENCMYSPDVVSLAREKGYFSGKDEDFSFAKAYNPYDFSGLRGCEARVWSFFNKYDKTMGKYADFVKGDPSKEPMPLYIKPNKKLSVQDVQNAMRDHYEGTDLDMTKDAGAGPYKVPYRWRPMNFKVDGETYVNERAIATQQTGFVIVPQMRNWLPDEIGGILWFGVDDADMAVFTPLYSSMLDAPECYRVGNGDMLTFSWTSAFWMHNWVANMAYHKYSFMIQDIRKVQQELENGYQDVVPAIDKAAAELLAKDPMEARRFLTWFSTTTADNATARWRKLGEYLTVKYIDGNVKKEEDGAFKRNPYGMAVSPDFPGYDEAYYRSIVKSAGERLKVKE
ncbi:dipeptidase [Parabacteroides sp. PF5-5]|uniref:dipeptidase n=1 Tax=unclassified Parabacteroides TaxID=2649774 RepID=UPI002476E564|nr:MULTISPECIES: C69 family dipeptidase [unclassified Parabacteroides]MDH6305872.1 dipeptidase [Parabacteroides sp. PH5-39]MDH6317314.1 dipeptidase [Parabacteroides sp. PF5-13]MDH6320522.1 dipeptidase [Parabacteroides sp. PH5-13]MDH6324315.1 dipeptidase [Parabacteroides sp. PH5-8]MDH6328512.1 dipeptidase [Parabacteroides sp. PH5-41]